MNEFQRIKAGERNYDLESAATPARFASSGPVSKRRVETFSIGLKRRIFRPLTLAKHLRNLLVALHRVRQQSQRPFEEPTKGPSRQFAVAVD